MNEALWHGYKKIEFEFDGKDAILVFPKTAEPGRNWLLKTEYWNAFPDAELDLLARGFHVAYLKNETRFATRSDCDRKAAFVSFLAKKYGLRPQCVPVGYSCGGAHAVNFAGFHPECVACLFIDAPVLNFCSYPGKLGRADCEAVWQNEFEAAYPGVTRAQLLHGGNHPLEKVPVLQAHRIPILMLYGTEDQTVNYPENGRLLELEYAACPELLTVIPRPLQGHHPHAGLYDRTPIAEFIWAHTH